MSDFRKPPKIVVGCMVAAPILYLAMSFEIGSPWSALGLLLVFVALVVWLGVEIFRVNFVDPVDKHVANLRTGGLIPRVDKHVHEKALRRIGRETPNVQLPKRQYYDE